MSGASSLALPDRVRLAKLLGMLGSDHAGERDAAGLAADKLVKGNGLGWADVLGAGSPGQTRSAPPPPSAISAAISLCLAHSARLTVWELGFISDLRCGQRRLTPAQIAKLGEIAARFVAA